MLICGLQKLAMVDYPGKLAATIFTGGCNLRCPFCHNALLVTELEQAERLDEEEVLAFLKKRRGILEGVCVTGGEPLLQSDLARFIRRVRELGYPVKLDTNGTSPGLLRDLLDEGLLDYVAMDIKNSPAKYAATVGVPDFDLTPVRESAALLMEGRAPYEFRTTLVREFHTVQDMEAIGLWLRGAENYFLQTFVDSGGLIGSGMSPLKTAETKAFQEAAKPYFGNVFLRG